MTQQQFTHYLTTQAQAHLSKADRLMKNDKQDEAIMEKIRANMYKVAAAFISMAERRTPHNVFTSAKERINNSLLPQWRNALAEARKHGDYVKTTHEEIKISTMEEIIKIMETQKNE